MSKISIIVPTRNNQDTVLSFAKELIDVCETRISNYEYEIIFVDNNSSDQTKSYLARLCEVTQKVKCAYTVADYGFELAAKYGMTLAEGECVITMKPDRTHPIAAIPKMLELWEEGSKIIVCARSKGGTNPIFNGLRNIYCNILFSSTGTKTMKQFTGFCLYDKSFVKTITSKAYKNMQIRSVINTLGLSYMVLPYTPSKSAPGSSFSQKYDASMSTMTTYPKGTIRLISMLGFYGGTAMIIAGIVTMVIKIVLWNSFTAAIPLILLVGGVLMIFSSVIAEYISSICQKLDAATFVKEEERINVSSNDKKANK
ncbi:MULTISPECIES: glycosyltransferase [unclassified Ruminococcus]|uniref:glycosyltransferase n=1 Tax=unclassified Ruminococcus TaxID=2608920 RepID=UPI00210E2028|nr:MULTISPECIES: glycosyltransferase [unclassified Ruminococcus]MCQ4022626.1 glycosyltransferase [Ruminococcus sp. zg-924]MCQ4114866.1 glycosyltransferase [Ruminococcus sp. zg-921]